VCYTQGAPGFCTNNNFFLVYNSNTSVALGWVADGIFTGTAAGGSQVELTTAWSALAFYEHIWNPKWRTAVGGGYVNVDYNANATTAILQKTLGAAAACNVAAVGAATTVFTLTPGNGCNPDVSFWEAYMRTQWNPWRSSISVSKFCTRGVTPPSRVQASSRSTARVLRSSSSTTRTSGLAWCAGSVTSIHDGLLSHHGFNLQTLGGKPPRVLLWARARHTWRETRAPISPSRVERRVNALKAPCGLPFYRLTSAVARKEARFGRSRFGRRVDDRDNDRSA
jgi:hypothetical protein